MSLIAATIATALTSGLTVAGSLAYGRLLVGRAKQRIALAEAGADDLVAFRAKELLQYIEGVRASWRTLDPRGGLDISAIVAQRNRFRDTVTELTTERDDLVEELAAYRVDAIEQGRVADTYARQSGAADEVIDHLTAQLHEAGLTIALPSRIAEAHAESLIRTGLKGRVGRTYGSIGRAA